MKEEEHRKCILGGAVIEMLPSTVIKLQYYQAVQPPQGGQYTWCYSMGVVLPTIGQHSGAPPRDFAICSEMTPGIGIFSPTLLYGLDIPMSVLMTHYVQIYVSSLHPSLNSLLLSQLAKCCEYLSQKDPKHESSLLCPPNYFILYFIP